MSITLISGDIALKFEPVFVRHKIMTSNLVRSIQFAILTSARSAPPVEKEGIIKRTFFLAWSIIINKNPIVTKQIIFAESYFRMIAYNKYHELFGADKAYAFCDVDENRG